MKTRGLDRLGWLFLMVMAAILLYQVACPPRVGLSGNGDFWRITESFGLTYPAGRPAGLVAWNRYYDWDGRILRTKMFPSSELLPAGLAIALSDLVSRHKVFDTVILGLVHALLYLLAVSLAVFATRQWRTGSRIAFCLLLLLIFTDVGYVSYFNSLYTEPGSLIFFAGGMGILASILLREDSDPRLKRLIPAFFVVMGLFVLTKVQAAPLGLVLAILGCCLSRGTGLQDDKLRAAVRRRGTTLAVIFAALSVLFWWGFKFVPGTHVNNVYNMVFNEITPRSHNPQSDLRELGLDISYIRYVDTVAWSPGVTEPLRRQVYAKVGDARVIAFFIRHPSRLWDLVRRCAQSAFITRVPYLGNFETSAVANIRFDPRALERDLANYVNRGSESPFELPAAFRSQSFSFWSGLKENWVPKTWWFLGIWLFANLAAIGVKRRWYDRTWRQHLITKTHLALVLCGVLEFAIAVIGEGERDIAKHLFIFDLISDVCFVFIAAYVYRFISDAVSRSINFNSKDRIWANRRKDSAPLGIS